MASSKNWTKAFFSGLWTALNFLRNMFFNIIFIVIVVGLIAAFMSDDGKVEVPTDSALVLSINGNIVIEEVAKDPFDEFVREAFEQAEDNPEVLLQDILFAIDNAKQDRRIKALVLNLQGLRGGGMDKLKQVAMALEDFKTSEKPIYAVGDYYTQSQYYLASHADHLYLNPMGGLMLDGFGRYRMYYKSALEKLKATTHVFRVGTFKSAVEPVLRDDMSDEAKEANQEWLDALWEAYKQDVANAREMDMSNFDEQFDSFNAKFEVAGGDFAQYALQNNWVDALKTRDEVREELIALVGSDDSRRGFNSITFDQYMQVLKMPFDLPDNGSDKVGVVVAKGTILNGTQKAGTIGGDSTARLLRKARNDDSIKAVVLQVDSPGGSAFASEVIRQEITLLQAAGKPVVASMSSLAASGGYWISTSADEIWAAPTTITGSIGIFGMFMTYEDTLDYLGIHTDGVGTTEFTGLTATRRLDPRLGNIFQRSIEHGYDQFIGLVAESRSMDVEQVDKIAQGRVWIGSKAKELGLIDELGYLDDAVKSAANLAGLETYDTKYVQRTLSSTEQFWREFLGSASAMMGKAIVADSDNQLMQIIGKVVADFNAVAKLNDPRGMYAYCLMCEY